MNALKVKRYYEIKEQIKNLETEAKMLNDEIKDEMQKNNIKEMTVGNYHLNLQRQDRSEVKDTIIPYLKQTGHTDLIVETYDREKFKELAKWGAFDEEELKKHRIEKIIYALYIKQF